jgi:hypothetical protein
LSALTGGVARFIIISAIVPLGFLQEGRAQNAVEALQAKVALRAKRKSHRWSPAAPRCSVRFDIPLV